LSSLGSAIAYRAGQVTVIAGVVFVAVIVLAWLLRFAAYSIDALLVALGAS
jgi:hypothetical protein